MREKGGGWGRPAPWDRGAVGGGGMAGQGRRACAIPGMRGGVALGGGAAPGAGDLRA